MKFILLDTNIILDMVIDRRHQVTDGLLKSFIKLLDYNEIKLIVPEIVKIETLRHLDEELALVGTKIEDAKKAIDNTYGIALYSIKGLDLKTHKKNARAEFNDAFNTFEANKKDYKEDLHNTIDKLFTHNNSVFIPTDDFLCIAVLKRRMFKKAPFHREAKESYGDGLITETLINLGKYLALNNNDELFFVTGNYKDFCVSKENKTTLLPDIITDISNNLPINTECVNTFGELINIKLKENVDNANLSEEFEQELARINEIQMYEDIKTMERESVGLHALDNYTPMMEENLPESDFANELLKIFDDINSVYTKLENIDISIYEDIKSTITDSPISEIQTILQKFKNLFDSNTLFPSIGDDGTMNFRKSDIDKVYVWVNQQLAFFESVIDLPRLPDNINFGDTIEIITTTFDKVFLKIDELNLNPVEGDTESINLSLRYENSKEIAGGVITLTVGEYCYDEDGGLADAMDDDIEYSCDDIIYEIKNLRDNWNTMLKFQEEVTNYIKNNF